MIYLEGNTFKFTDPAVGEKVWRCRLDIYTLKLNYTNNEGEININEKTVLTFDSINFNG